MFWRLGFGLAPRAVRSDQGFDVKLGVIHLTYVEGDHALKVPVETGVYLEGADKRKKTLYYVGLNQIKKWDAPFEHEVIRSYLINGYGNEINLLQFPGQKPRVDGSRHFRGF